MTTIDQRVVDMRFDNAQFERGVDQSVKSLDRLKAGLDLNGATQSLNTLNKAGQSFSLAGISEGIDRISEKFTTFGIMGITVIQNLTNSAINMGKKMVSALTIDPIKTGFSEYETKMNALTTILTNTASKGTTLSDVNAVLDELNTYADQTIYNFAEMTRNIGTFTAAGIDLRTSATAIKGIANLAAGSGSTSQQASMAMYQLSQALASGTVKLMDWNSVVNAGMGGELFQKALEKTAVELGNGRNMAVSFRESLQSGWITTEVLTKTLEKFANDEALVKAATQVKTFTQLWDTMKESVQSGWAQTWEAIVGDREQATKALTSISDAFGSIMGKSADARNETLKFWNANGGRDALINAITNAFKGLSEIIKPINEAFRDVFPAVTGERLVEISKGIESLSEQFKMGEKTTKGIKLAFTGLFTVVDGVATVIGTLAKGAINVVSGLTPLAGGVVYLAGAIGSLVTSLVEGISFTNIFTKATKGLGDIIYNLTSHAFDGIVKIGDLFLKLSTGIAKAMGAISLSISDGLESFRFDKLFAVINGGLFAAVLLGLRKFINSMSELVGSGGGILSGITGLLDGVKGSLTAYQSQLKAGTLLKIASAIGILAASLTVLSMIDPAKLASALAGMSVLFVELFGAMAMFEKVSGGLGIKAMATITTAMLGMSTAILLLSFAVSKLAKLDWNGIAKGLVAVAGLAAVLVGSSKLLTLSSGKIMKGSLGFVVFAASLLILAEAVEKLSSIDVGGLAKGLISIGVLGAGLVAFMKTADMGAMGLRSSAGILILAGAVSILADSVKKFSAIDTTALIKGLVGLGVVLAEITLFVNLTGNAKSVMTTAIGLTVLGGAILIFAKAIGAMGKMSPAAIAKGLITLAGALTIIGVAMHLMQTSIAGAAALLIISGALSALANVLGTLGAMSIGSIVLGLASMAGIFAVLGAAAILLTPLIPALLGLGVAISLFGIAALAAGAGMLAFSAGLTGLAVAGAAGVSALVVLFSSIIGLIPAFLTQVGEGIVQFAKALAGGATVIAESVVTIIAAILETLAGSIPDVVDSGMDIVLGLLQGIANNIGKITVVAVEIVSNFIDGLSSMMPKLIASGFNLILTFINGLADAVREYTPLLMSAVVNLGDAMIDGVIKGLLGGIGRAVNTVKNLGSDLINNFKNVLGIESPSKVFAEAGGNIVAGLSNGIEQSVPKAKASSKQLAEEALKSVRETAASISVKDGQYIADGIIIGLVSKQPDMKEASKLLAQAIKNGLIEETPRFMGVGETSATEFLKGVSDEEIISNAWAAGIKVSSSAWQGAKSTAEQMAAAGTAAGQAYIDGLNAAAQKAADKANSILDNVVSGRYSKQREQEARDRASGAALSMNELSKLTDAEAKKYWEAGGGKTGTEAVKSMKEAGKNAGTAMADGLSSSLKSVSDSAKSLAESAKNAVKKTLGINSPSKVFMEFGGFAGLGFVNGLLTMRSKILVESEKVANSAIDGLSNALSQINTLVDSNLDTSPVIRPVIDLNDLQNGITSATKMFNMDNPLAVSIANSRKSQGGNSEKSDGSTGSSESKMEFNQYNYSPKALSRIDIYRQTNNQLIAAKGRVTG